MKKILTIVLTIAMFSCNSNENNSAKNNLSENSSNLELAKSSLDNFLKHMDDYEDSDSTNTAEYGSKLDFQLDSVKDKLTEEELILFNEYMYKRFEEEYERQILEKKTNNNG